MKKGLAVIIIIAAFLFSLGLIAWVYAAEKAPDVFKIDDNKSFFKDGKRTKPPIEFSHLKHEKNYKIACTECHHLYKDGKNIWKQGVTKVQECHECHKATDQGKTLSLQNAFHKNCKDCHIKLKSQGKPTGPTLCAKCHVVAKK